MAKKSYLTIILLVLSLGVVSVVLANPPDLGTVYEGESVPGIALNDTRAEVVAANGPPKACSSVEAYADMASCKYELDSGGRVFLRYRGPDGGNASNSPDDVVKNIRWYNVDGWLTTHGVNTTLANNDREAVVAAYPDAVVSYNNTFDPDGPISNVRDTELGIDITWSYNFYSGFTTVSMNIFEPYIPPPPPDYIHVESVKLWLVKHDIAAEVLVLDEENQPVEGASVGATWYFPDGSPQPVSGQTGRDGTVNFGINRARRGTYYLYVDDVFKAGFEYDYINSNTIGVISKNKGH